MKKLLKIILTSVMLVSLLAYPAFAEEQPKITWTEGPTTVDIGKDLATLKLAEPYIFAGSEDTKKIMKYYQNPVSNQEVGLVMPKDNKEAWFILFEYDPIGFVKDDDSKDLDADKIYESLKKGNEEQNKKLAKKNIPPLELKGWDEKPHYDETTHNLVWSIIVESEGIQSINYNTRLLGRFGMVSVTLVSDPEDLTKLKPVLNEIINNFSYKEGKKYTDFIPGKDKVAEIGLTALIAGGAGVAAAKAGLFAKILLLFKKFWFILFAPIAAIYKKIKNRGNKTSPKDNSYEEV